MSVKQRKHLMFTKFLDPKNDIAFKKIFGTEKNKDILIHFLNDMIVFKDNGHIVDVSFLKTDQNPDTSLNKTSIVDILCTDQNENIYVVEMQVASEAGFEKRAQYYAAKAYCSQAYAGGKYQNLKEVIFLAIADFVMFPNKKAYKSDHVILDKDNYDHDLKDFSFTFIELPKFKKDIDHLTSMAEKWTYFFKHAEDTSEEELQKLTASDQIIKRAFHELDRFSWNAVELRTYDQMEKYINCYHASMDKKFDDGKAVGKEEGEAIGIAKGIALEKANIAKNLIASGMDLEKVQEITELNMELLQELASETTPTFSR